MRMLHPRPMLHNVTPVLEAEIEERGEEEGRQGEGSNEERGATGDGVGC